MPHKHKRKRGDGADYELPPTQTARPLPVGKSRPAPDANPDKRAKKKQRKSKSDDDAPRAFKRIMAAAQGQKFRSGLDDGTRTKPGKKAKPAKPAAAAAASAPTATAPQIRPGEDMRSFAARVDAALPIIGLTKKTVAKDGKDEQGFKVRKTKKERQMHKLYDQWREEERKIQEQKEEELEAEAERELENDGEGIDMSKFFVTNESDKGKKKKGKRKKEVEEDPWLEVVRRRAETKPGLHDVAMAPPQLHKGLSRQLKVTDGATVDVGSVPKAAGSLRRREELNKERADVVEAYRKIREHEQAKLNKKKE